MNYEKVKKESVSKLPFVTHAVVEDQKVKSVEITVDGKPYLITGEWDGVNISVPKPDKIEEQWLVSGEIEGAEIKPKHYKHRSDAKTFVNDLTVNHDLKINKCLWNVTKQCLVDYDTTDVVTEDDEDKIPF